MYPLYVQRKTRSPESPGWSRSAGWCWGRMQIDGMADGSSPFEENRAPSLRAVGRGIDRPFRHQVGELARAVGLRPFLELFETALCRRKAFDLVEEEEVRASGARNRRAAARSFRFLAARNLWTVSIRLDGAPNSGPTQNTTKTTAIRAQERIMFEPNTALRPWHSRRPRLRRRSSSESGHGRTFARHQIKTDTVPAFQQLERGGQGASRELSKRRHCRDCEDQEDDDLRQERGVHARFQN